MLLVFFTSSLWVFGQSENSGNNPSIDRIHSRLPFRSTVGHKVTYHLYMTDTVVNFTGVKRKAMVINGTLPAPALDFTEGDSALIYVHNDMRSETSVHWHGLLLPNRYDGVSDLTTARIESGATHLYKFRLKQNGTYFYHAHTTTQQQNGLYGAFIIHKPSPDSLREINLVISDWTNENPNQVYRSLRSQTDWYAIKKGSVQDYLAAIKTGHFGTKFKNEWKRMQAMDVSDVYYDRFFSNGTVKQYFPDLQPGEKVRLRIINGSSSTYYWLNYAGGKMTVVANDGQDVEPVAVDRMIIAVAETYDVIITVPAKGSFEFRTTPEDRTSSTSLFLGTGTLVNAVHLEKLNYFKGMVMMNNMMGMDGRTKGNSKMKMSNQRMDMNRVMYPEANTQKTTATSMADHKRSTGHMDMDPMVMNGNQSMKMAEGPVTLNYNMLRATAKTSLPPGPKRTFEFELTGNMVRYLWTINNKTLSESDKILIKKGENIRLILKNRSMMRHPMHLHGHFFRLLNGKGENAPLKNTLDIMPMEVDTIEFAASESGDWLFHCHILYHNMSGMGRIFSYVNSPLNQELGDTSKALRKVYADDRQFAATARVELESNGSDGRVGLVNARWVLQSTWHLGTSSSKGYESETTIGRYIDRMQWFYSYLGFDYHRKTGEEDIGNNLFGQSSNKNNRKTIIAGLVYTLPLLFQADARIDGNAKLRLQLSREDIPLTSRLRMNVMGNSDKEYSAGLRYVVTKYFSISGHHDSDMGTGGGITLTY
ncbi:multicopper oxidase family protein [Mucilaginibacter aquariorum]|nr:multicopper oxidase family protein [Mucilaginibacter aquariorum]